MQVKIINQSNNPLPAYKTAESAGMDLYANLEASITLAPLERTLIPTGIFIELPIGYEAQVRPRSGLAFKQGLSVLNTPGTIDSDYRGEIKVILVNLSNTEQIITTGERVAQLVVAKHERVAWQAVEVLTEGTGATPKLEDEVSVHYHGTLIDGTVFDSSVDRGQPASFPVSGVIPGWTEALQLMKVGSKWQVYIPSELAYGERGAGGAIGPNETLIFDVELLEIK